MKPPDELLLDCDVGCENEKDVDPSRPTVELKGAKGSEAGLALVALAVGAPADEGGSCFANGS